LQDMRSADCKNRSRPVVAFESPVVRIIRNYFYCATLIIALPSVMPSTTSALPARPPAATPTPPAHVHDIDVCRRTLGSDRAVADMLDVSPSQVSRWRRGQAADPDNADRLGGLALAIEMLERWLEPGTIAGWLRGPNAHLDDRTPAYLIRRGQVADVIGAVEAEKAGVFA